MTSLVTGLSIVPSTETLYGCNWKAYPVIVDPKSSIYSNRSYILDIIDQKSKDPIIAAQLNTENLCPIAKIIQEDFIKAVLIYHGELKYATEKDRGRDRQVSRTLTLSIGSTYQKIDEEFQVRYHRSPNWLEKTWIGIKATFVTKNVSEITLQHFPDEYNDYHRREWMVKCYTQETARICKAFFYIRQGAIKYATNIKDSIEDHKPIHDNDIIYLEQLINLHNIIRPGQTLNLGELGTAKHYLDMGKSS